MSKLHEHTDDTALDASPDTGLEDSNRPDSSQTPAPDTFIDAPSNTDSAAKRLLKQARIKLAHWWKNAHTQYSRGTLACIVLLVLFAIIAIPYAIGMLE